MARRTRWVAALGAAVSAAGFTLVLFQGPQPELRWVGEENDLGYGHSAGELAPGETYVEGAGLIRLCTAGDAEATITDVAFDERENLEVTGWATLPQTEVLELPEREDIGSLEGQGYDRTSHGVSTPCDQASGPEHQTYLAVEVRWTGGDLGRGSGLRVTYEGERGGGELTGDVDLVLCGDAADCERDPLTGASPP